MPMKNRFGVWIFLLLLLLLLLLILGFKMLGHHSWAKNREPYANGMKVGLSASSFLFSLIFKIKLSICLCRTSSDGLEHGLYKRIYLV
jgi:Na+/H+ antiporter NhaC